MKGKFHFVSSQYPPFCLSCRAFHHYRDAKEAVAKHPELDRLLREEYRSMDDFKREKAKNASTKREIKHSN